MNKHYRCLTCGFVLTIDDSQDAAEMNRLAHKEEMKGVANDLDCPSCHKHMKRGPRKPEHVNRPDITAAGTLEDESIPEVLAKRKKMDEDFNELTNNRGAGKIMALRGKYSGKKKIFGFSVDDLIQQHDTIKKS